MGILDAIAQPQMADIAGALDVRQKRLDADEAKRKEIRMGQLIAEATPNLIKGSALHQLALDDPKGYMALTHAYGVPLNRGDLMQEITGDVEDLYTVAQSNPRNALDLAMQKKQQRNDMGIETPQIDKFIARYNADDKGAVSELIFMHRSLNQEKPMSESDKLAREKFEYEKTNGGGSGGLNSHAQDLATYKALKDANDPDAEGFAQMVNLKSREGRELSADVTKIINDLDSENVAANNSAIKYSGLSSKIRKANYTSGVMGTWGEASKKIFGDEDEITSLKKQVALIRNSEALKSLPAGSASEKDVSLVMEPMPDANSNPEYVANWLDAYSKVAKGVAKYTSAKARFIAKNGAVRDKNQGSFIDEWERQNNQAGAPATPPNNAAQGSQKATNTETPAERFARMKNSGN